MTDSLFEGTEKKFELVILDKNINFRKFDRTFWENIVEKAEAKILSAISSDQCDAYLLSESSLFVFNQRVLMITCGTTKLVQAAEELFKSINIDSIAMFVYERKNEMFPDSQLTTFDEDEVTLSKYFPCQSFTFGDNRSNHIRLLTMDRTYKPHERDMTLEVLMHQIPLDVSNRFGEGASGGIPEIFDGFTIDDYKFEPIGYSLNAVRNDEYFTIHVTPQKEASYVSFETNVCINSNLGNPLQKVVNFFKPQHFDFLLFDNNPSSPANLSVEGYDDSNKMISNLKCGYEITYTHFERNS